MGVASAALSLLSLRSQQWFSFCARLCESVYGCLCERTVILTALEAQSLVLDSICCNAMLKSWNQAARSKVLAGARGPFCAAFRIKFMKLCASSYSVMFSQNSIMLACNILPPPSRSYVLFARWASPFVWVCPHPVLLATFIPNNNNNVDTNTLRLGLPRSWRVLRVLKSMQDKCSRRSEAKSKNGAGSNL